MNSSELSAPLELYGRQAQFQQITHALAQDKDLLIAGVPGSGRRTLVRRAAAEVGAKIVEVDCIRATDGQRLVQLICEGISQAVKSQGAIAFLREWVTGEAAQFFVFKAESRVNLQLILSNSTTEEQLWQAYQLLLKLPQQLADAVGRQVVIILQSFPHIRFWDRNRRWEKLLRSEIKRQTEASYVLVATLAETSERVEESDISLETVKLTPLADDVVAAWASTVLHREGLTFDPRSRALERFLNAVQGHLGDASTLVRRLCNVRISNGLIGDRQIEQTIREVLTDLSTIFESLLVLLPASQAQLLESLALDPTNKPQSREYINKHHLSRGGSLQGAIAGLQHKGLIYGAELDYRIALPLFALWIRQRLS
ncbi:ATP-binding protein [Pleurocapsales cyanobacterium LEGE 06147]|nr:ATP-binding protein [Pleurocapsales cyanobacterium LEGE 06147]